MFLVPDMSHHNPLCQCDQCVNNGRTVRFGAMPPCTVWARAEDNTLLVTDRALLWLDFQVFVRTGTWPNVWCEDVRAIGHDGYAVSQIDHWYNDGPWDWRTGQEAVA